ncbi:MAG: NAD(P)H-dependent oxidoreductase [Alphaproteobacteria bacterium]
MAKILAFAGSARRDSFNKKLIKIAAEGASAAGAEVTLIDLADYPMPIYDGDLEVGEGLPENAAKLRALFGSHDALLIASPEYNSSISPLLKNTIDWVSRPTKDDGQLKYFIGKVAGLVSASPGGLGGLRGLVHVRAILGNIQVTVIPQQAAIGGAGGAFDDDGGLKDENQRNMVLGVGKRLAEVAAKLA